MLIWKAVVVLGRQRNGVGREVRQRWSELQMVNLPVGVSMTVTDETRPHLVPMGQCQALRSQLICLCSVSDFAGSSCEPGLLNFYVNQRQFTFTFRNQLKARHEFKFSKSGIWLHGDIVTPPVFLKLLLPRISYRF